MTTKELRLGNLVNHCGEIITVDGIDDIDIFNSKMGDVPVHSVEPIPLTDEWLEKFGFQNVKNLYFYYSNFRCKIERLAFSWDVRFIVASNHSVSIKKIFFVHQLQNIYFALTNEDLVIQNQTV